MINRVELTKQARKDLKKVPVHFLDKFETWVENVEEEGLVETRKITGYHDELLSGKRKGQRSIRLSRHYRAIYQVVKDSVEFCEVQEVNKHDY